MSLIDTYRHKGLRAKLSQDLIQKGISDEKIINAIKSLPRHFFLDRAFEEWAYKDVAFPIDNGQTISQPYTVAFQTQLLELDKKDHVLEIGTGSGYQACILSLLGVRVYTIERHEELFKKTAKFLSKIGFDNIRTFWGDGFIGLPRFAPYDKILVTAGAQSIPKILLDQLKVGGMMVIPQGTGETQKMIKILKTKDKYIKTEHGQFSFVPMLEGTTQL